MEIKNLANTDISSIVECLSKSFQNYFVKMPSEVEFWSKRFQNARVDFNLSFGVFDNGVLVAFIIHGIDYHNEELTAYNTGTGVLEAYRGQKLVDQMYNFAIPILKENGIKKCLLEVIEQNHVALRVYERIGFTKLRLVRCFNGEQNSSESTSDSREVDISLLKHQMDKVEKYYSWDNSLSTILKGGNAFKFYAVTAGDGSDIGYFVINTNNNALIQIEAYDDSDWMKIIASIKNIISPLRINNVDSNRVRCNNALIDAGIENHINQFEMNFYI